MPNPNAIVSTVISLDPPLDRAPADLLKTERGVSVELEGGRRVRLDPANPRSTGFLQILDGLRKERLTVYLEIDPATTAVTRLLIPHVSRVTGVRPLEQGALAVQLERSHARHVLRRDLPDFAEIERLLREAERGGRPVILTEDDAHSIIDVRFAPPLPGPPWPPSELPPRGFPWVPRWIRDLFRWIWRWPWWPWWWCRCVTPAMAQQVFDAMNATSCNPLTVPPPCIPFLYPDDGCWARAHEMCRLMIDLGLSPKKVWIEGSLNVQTKNNPNCEVWWGWHVAPTLCVRGPGFLQSQRMVIDPSLFATPVTEPTWKGVQGDPNATLTETAAAIYYLWGSVTDPNYTETNSYLAYYRLQLQNRALQYGPPPYA